MNPDEIVLAINELRITQGKTEVRLDNMDKVLCTQQKILDGMQNITLAVRDLANAQGNTAEKVERLTSDVDDLKNKPAKRMDTIQTVIITAIISGIIGFLVKTLFG